MVVAQEGAETLTTPDHATCLHRLPIVFGEEDAHYRSLAEAKAILGQIMALYNEVNATVSDERAVLPADCCFRPDILDNLEDSVPIGQWSRGLIVHPLIGVSRVTFRKWRASEASGYQLSSP